MSTTLGFVVVLLSAMTSAAQDVGVATTEPSQAGRAAGATVGSTDGATDATTDAGLPSRADLAHARRLLEGVRDNVFSFDDPAFYEFCRYVKQHPDAAASAIGDAETAVPWKFLLERPSDYRGQRIVIEGVLQARIPFEVSGFGREGIGTLHQCELSEIDTRSLCAVITTEDPADIPIRSRVIAKGFFIKVRGYRTGAGRVGAGPLLVARRLALVRPPSSGLGDLMTEGPRGDAWIIIGTAAMAVVWLVLRRSTRKTAPAGAGSSRHIGKTMPSDEDFDWLLEMSASRESRPSTDDKTSRGD